MHGLKPVSSPLTYDLLERRELGARRDWDEKRLGRDKDETGCVVSIQTLFSSIPQLCVRFPSKHVGPRSGLEKRGCC